MSDPFLGKFSFDGRFARSPPYVSANILSWAPGFKMTPLGDVTRAQQAWGSSDPGFGVELRNRAARREMPITFDHEVGEFAHGQALDLHCHPAVVARVSRY